MTSHDGLDFGGYKSGYVALLGKPNVGKSTLLNGYLGQKVAAVSIKPQTTRRRQLGILTTEDAQIIFVDTPGLHKGGYKLSNFINQEACYALMDADLILFMVDVSQLPDEDDRWLAQEVAEKAQKTQKLLVLNKTDRVDSTVAEQNALAYVELLDFVDRIYISAITTRGQDALLKRVIELLPEGPQYFPDDQITDIYERNIAEDLIRSTALTFLRDEVPYGLYVRVDDYKLRENDVLYIHATLIVDRESHKGIVIGRGGSMIKQISTVARREIEEMSGNPVFLELKVKVVKNWRNDQNFLRQYGLSHD
ncbi:MAG: GTPase Era [Brevefilum fermentans]|jgi:GTP-binding protein Era|uniref:GTPase Era n=1 Tax=Candidatus Brevifilum fermentans TaxID=1986204 RepID=A0A1Y6K4L0_9CHLR|nr:GTPase Era [Brevefilum fermentans]MDI9567211.1 GTPase Era [Chloroflexota bacterium]SMX54603.1 GTPase Era [Brevefilum fermentans]HOM67112.1 GTPase Era [Brevefilum fermentans]